MNLETLRREMTPDQIVFEINRGARFVIYQYCFSIVVMTFRRNSEVIFVKADESVTSKGLPYTLMSALLGWWGIPWGFIYTPQVIYRNLKGGTDVTANVLANLRSATAPPPPPVPPPPIPSNR
jgi:hypothetical protein